MFRLERDEFKFVACSIERVGFDFDEFKFVACSTERELLEREEFKFVACSMERVRFDLEEFSFIACSIIVEECTLFSNDSHGIIWYMFISINDLFST